MLAGIETAGLMLPPRHPGAWVVDCKAVGSGEKALVYLGRYLYRGVIREQDIVACADGQVSFRYRDAKTGKLERRTVPGAQFLWLVLQHVLPKGFRRARNYGFLHPNRKAVDRRAARAAKAYQRLTGAAAAAASDAQPVLQRGHDGGQNTDSAKRRTAAACHRQPGRSAGHVSVSTLQRITGSRRPQAEGVLRLDVGPYQAGATTNRRKPQG